MIILTDKGRNNVLDKYNRSYFEIAFNLMADGVVAGFYSLAVIQTRYIVDISWLLLMFLLFGTFCCVVVTKWILTPFFKGFDSFSELYFPPLGHYLALGEKLGIIQSKSVFSSVFRLAFTSLYSIPALYLMMWCIHELDQFWTLFSTYRIFVAFCTFTYLLLLSTLDWLDIPTGVEFDFTPAFTLTCSKPKPKQIPVADVIVDTTAVAETVNNVPVDT